MLRKGQFIFPFWGTHVKIAKTARINVRGRLHLNGDKFPHARQDCLVSLADGAVWDVNGRMLLRCQAIVQILPNAHLITGDDITANYGFLITCRKKITIGNYVAMARLTFISDTDFHPQYDSTGKRANEDKETIIEDHVWIGLKSTIMKGTHIGAGSVIGANSLVSGKVPPRTLSVTVPARPVMKDISWER